MFQCRTRLCGWCSKKRFLHSMGFPLFQCRTRLCGWCSQEKLGDDIKNLTVSMPHAALWVVQPGRKRATNGNIWVSMPHAALWVVQHEEKKCGNAPHCFNAARGFVGGAARRTIGRFNGLDMFQCRTRLCGWCSADGTLRQYPPSSVSMPHAALWVVQPAWGDVNDAEEVVSMPHAALWVVQQEEIDFLCLVRQFQCRTRLCGWCSPVDEKQVAYLHFVSMPHAALWVVQQERGFSL